jgi:hypothetical protein
MTPLHSPAPTLRGPPIAARKALKEPNGDPVGHKNGDGVEPLLGEAIGTSNPALCAELEPLLATGPLLLIHVLRTW